MMSSETTLALILSRTRKRTKKGKMRVERLKRKTVIRIPTILKILVTKK